MKTKKKTKLTKTQAILKYMRTHKFITDPIAREKHHTNRLSGIIHNLRNKGYEIETVMCNGRDEFGTYSYGKYRLIKEPEQ